MFGNAELTLIYIAQPGCVLAITNFLMSAASKPAEQLVLCRLFGFFFSSTFLFVFIGLTEGYAVGGSKRTRY